MTVLKLQSENKTADDAQPRNVHQYPDPFPSLRMGSGNETNKHLAQTFCQAKSWNTTHESMNDSPEVPHGTYSLQKKRTLLYS